MNHDINQTTVCVTIRERVAHCRGQIASFKVPRVVRFVQEWPMSSTKIQKFRLRDELLAELGSQAAAS
jgi:acyl-coenzyme A synthetase/AMP-(fatty) acid ligase